MSILGEFRVCYVLGWVLGVGTATSYTFHWSLSLCFCLCFWVYIYFYIFFEEMVLRRVLASQQVWLEEIEKTAGWWCWVWNFRQGSDERFAVEAGMEVSLRQIDGRREGS